MTAALEGSEWSTARPGRTLPRERNGTHFTGGCVGPRAGLDGRKISSPSGFNPGPSLYRLSYRTCNSYLVLNPLMPNDDYSGRTAPLTSKRCILYIYSSHIGTEYFKRSIYSPFFPLQDAVCFINLTYLVPVLFTFYVEDVLKLKK